MINLSETAKGWAKGSEGKARLSLFDSTPLPRAALLESGLCDEQTLREIYVEIPCRVLPSQMTTILGRPTMLHLQGCVRPHAERIYAARAYANLLKGKPTYGASY